MRHRTEEISVAWDSLARAEDHASGWRSIPISSSTEAMLCAGRRFPGREEALLAGFSAAVVPAAERLPDGHGFSVERVDPRFDGKTWLALTRRSTGSTELFLAMACDVADALDAAAGADEQQLLRAFLGRVRAWQEFMRKGAQPLGPEAEIGLIGELKVLSSIIEAGVSAAIACEAWVGPLDGRRDFELGTGGLEIKTTLAASGFAARIGSLDQLDDTVRQPLFVGGVRLRQAASGQGLPDFVEEMKDIVRGDAEAERLLSDRLIAAGYFDAHADSYSRRFVHAGLRVLRVAEGFPRLTPACVPFGVVRASYEIDLDKVPGPSLEIDPALKELGVI